jgi:hypothetical protein
MICVDIWYVDTYLALKCHSTDSDIDGVCTMPH